VLSLRAAEARSGVAFGRTLRSLTKQHDNDVVVFRLELAEKLAS
jgi:hypothetical protein